MNVIGIQSNWMIWKRGLGKKFRFGSFDFYTKMQKAEKYNFGLSACFYLVGTARFELATPASRTLCSTRLSHVPT
jgi:hypothetical protein